MNNQQPNYWCHQCNCRVKAISSLEDGEPICPICKESFVELLEESQNSNNNNNSSSTNQVINMDDMLDSALEGIFQQQQDADQTTIEANTAVSDDDDEGDDEEGDMDLETANAFLDAILSNRQHQQTPNSNNNSQQQQPIPDLLTLMNQMFGTGVGLGLGARNNRNNNNMNVNNNDGQQDSNVQQQANAQNNNPMDFINTLVNNLGVALGGGGAANTNMNAATTGGTANPTNVFSFNLNDVFNQINTGGAQLGDYFLGDNLQQLINHLFDHSGSSGPPPASKRAMDSLPIQKATSEFHDKECTICQDHYQDDEEIVTLPCSHVFHKDCLWPWLNRHGTCPTCRFKLETTEEAPNPDAIDPNQQPTDNNNTNINNNMNANLGAGPMNPFANLFNFAGMPPPNNTNGGPQVFQFSFPFGNPNPNVNNDNNRDNNNNTNNNNNNNNNGSGGNMSYFL